MSTATEIRRIREKYDVSFTNGYWYLEQELSGFPKNYEVAKEIRVRPEEGEARIFKLPKNWTDTLTLEWVEKKMGTKTAKEKTEEWKALMHGLKCSLEHNNKMSNLSWEKVFVTSYGLGFDGLYDNQDFCRQIVEDLKEFGIECKFDTSDNGWTNKLVVSKKKANVQIIEKYIEFVNNYEQ